jgi:GT2 family glycosyltransferase
MLPGIEGSSRTPVVSILIANWNGQDVLRDCLLSLAERTRGIEYEIIVVDDASTDRSVEMVRSEFPSVRLVVRTVNGGFVKTNNDGVRIARGKNVLLLNSDTLLLNNAVKILSEYLDEHPKVGVCGGWLQNPDGSSQVSFGHAPSFLQALTDAFFLNDLFPSAGFRSRGVLPRPGWTSPRSVEYITGADLMIRRSFVERFGLFDELYEAYCEEVDLCRRVRIAGGLDVHFVPEAHIVHLGGFSYGKRVERHVQMQHISYQKYLTKYHGQFYALLVRLLFAWHYLVKGAVRTARLVTAPRTKREGRKRETLAAWYHVRYSIWPHSRA